MVVCQKISQTKLFIIFTYKQSYYCIIKCIQSLSTILNDLYKLHVYFCFYTELVEIELSSFKVSIFNFIEVQALCYIQFSLTCSYIQRTNFIWPESFHDLDTNDQSHQHDSLIPFEVPELFGEHPCFGRIPHFMFYHVNFFIRMSWVIYRCLSQLVEASQIDRQSFISIAFVET